jgi:Rieske Fe-S protein
MNHSSRRCFLQVIGGTALAGAGVGACSSAGVGPDPVGDVPAGNIKDLPLDTLRAVGSKAVAIGRDANGVYAMTLTCSHAGCNMAYDGSVSYDGVYCSCHGSRFTNNGSVVSGPAPDPLQHFAVELDAAGELTIHGGQSVSASTRTAVT